MDLKCIYDTIDFIETNYNKPISVKDIERVSLYSYRNIQRIFKNACGETIGSYQKRLKIEKAYKLIFYSNLNFVQIALEVGFDNSASFSKAFKQYYGISPSEAKSNKTAIFDKGAIKPILSECNLKPEIVYRPAINIYYASIRTDYLNSDIDLLWEKTMRNIFPEKTEFYGVIADEPLITDKLFCRYDAGVSHQPLNKELPSKSIFGGRYAKVTHRGGYASIEETYRQIYGGWILGGELEVDHTPIIEHYVRHSGNCDLEELFQTDILIPLKQQ